MTAYSPDLHRRPFILCVPVGAFEQHGPHLPLDTDTRIADHVVRQALQHDERVLIAPTIAITASDEHEGLPGTLTLSEDTTVDTFVNIAQSIRRSSPTCLGTVFVNGHGGNSAAMRRADQVLASRGVPHLFWSPSYSASTDSHAGHGETSLMLAIDPSVVRMEHAVAGDVRDLSEIIDALRAGGVASVSPSGVLGNPLTATAEHGRELLQRCISNLRGEIDHLFGAWSR